MTTVVLLLLWLAIVAIFAGCAGVALRDRRMRAHVHPLEASHIPALDGLRGILALSVFAHHAYITRQAAISGSWGAPDNAFVQVLGLGSVAVFFMITAFLFWSRVLAASGNVAPLRLYGSRFRRIYPAFAGSIVLLLLVVGWETHFQLRESPGVVIAEIAGQLSLGIATGANVNGLLHANLIDAGVTWSLGFECGFYALLPVLALAVRVRKSWIAWIVVAVTALAFERHLWIVATFLPGIAVAELATRARAAAWFQRYGNALAYVGCTGLVVAVIVAPHALLTLAHGPQWDVVPQLIALGAIFAGVTLGSGPAFLKRPEVRFAGAISYSVYLFHAIVLYVASHALGALVPLRTLDPAAYLAFVFACVPLVVGLAVWSYVALEAPFLHARTRRILSRS